MLIVGGGLAGLSLATKLHAANVDFQLVEARARFGGRVHSPQLSLGNCAANFDMGPAWFWPGQPRMAALAKELGATVFSQWDQGQLVFEDERGRVQRADFSPMAGSLRIDGGMGVLIDALVATLPPERLHRNQRVTKLEGPNPKVRFLDSVSAQLIRLFGPSATEQALHLQDWALETHTATPLDLATHGHPDYGMPAALRDVWGSALLFASSEVATDFGGYLEGALGAAEAAARLISA